MNEISHHRNLVSYLQSYIKTNIGSVEFEQIPDIPVYFFQSRNCFWPKMCKLQPLHSESPITFSLYNILFIYTWSRVASSNLEMKEDDSVTQVFIYMESFTYSFNNVYTGIQPQSKQLLHLASSGFQSQEDKCGNNRIGTQLQINYRSCR